MKKIFKLVFSLIIILAILITAAIFILPQVVDPNDYREDIAKIVEENTGRKLEIGGNIKLTFFPWLGLNLNNVTLYDNPQFSENRFVTVNNAQVQLKVMPLIHKRIEADVIRLDGLSVQLSRDAEGHTNWEDLQKSNNKNQEKSQIPLSTIKGIELKNTEIIWDDKMTGDSYVLSNLNLQTGIFQLGKPLHIQLNTDMESKGKQKLTGHIDMDAEINPDLDNQHYQIAVSRSTITVQGEKIPNKKQTLVLNANIDADLKQQKVALNNVKAVVDENQLDILNLNMDLATNILNIDNLSLVATVQGDKIPNKKQRVNLYTSINANVKQKTVTLNNVKLVADKNQLNIPIVNMDLMAQTINIDTLLLRALDVSINAKIQGKQLFSMPIIYATLNTSEFNLKQVLSQLGKTVPPNLPTSLTKARLKTSVEASSALITMKEVDFIVDDNSLKSQSITFNPKKSTVSLDLVLNALGMTVSGNINASDLSTKPNFSGKLTSSTFNLRELLSKLGQTPPHTADSSTLTRVSLNAEVQGSDSHINLKNMNLRLDDSQLNGELAVNNFKKPALNFALNVDKIDLDRYLPPKDERKENREEQRETNAPLPTDKLRNLDMNGRVKINQLTVNKLRIQNANLIVSAKQGKITISSKNTQLYKGIFTGNIALDAQKTTPFLDISGDLSSVQAQPLMIDLMGKSNVQGTANLTVRLNANATTPKTLQETISGTIDFAFTKGTLEGFNLGYTLRQAKAVLKKQPIPPPEPLKTDFSELHGSFTVKNGVFQTKEVNLLSPVFRVSGRGQLVLPEKTADFDITAAVVDTTKGESGKSLEELKGYSIPIKIQGKLDNLQVNPNLEAWLAEEAKARAEAKLEEKKQQLLEKHQEKIDKALGKETGKLLKDLNLGDFLKQQGQ